MKLNRKHVDAHTDSERMAIRAACAYIDEDWRELMYDISRFAVVAEDPTTWFVYARESVYTVELHQKNKSHCYRVRGNARRDKWLTIEIKEIDFP